jgi:hypothetical protein
MSLYYQYPLLTATECQQYIDYYESKPQAQFVLDWPGDNRRHSLVTVNPESDLWRLFTSRIAHRHQEVIGHLDRNISSNIRFFEVFVSKYNTHDQVLWHVDRPLYQREGAREVQPKNPRLYNTSVNLNSNYTGGDLSIRDGHIEETINKTPVGIATSFLTKNYHQIDTITSGERYSLITWTYAEDPEYYTGCNPHKWVINA